MKDKIVKIIDCHFEDWDKGCLDCGFDEENNRYNNNADYKVEREKENHFYCEDHIEKYQKEFEIQKKS